MHIILTISRRGHSDHHVYEEGGGGEVELAILGLPCINLSLAIQYISPCVHAGVV